MTKLALIMSNLVFLAAEDGEEASTWSIDNLLQNIITKLGTWGSLIVTLAGLVMVIVAVVLIAKGLIQGQRGQTNWVLVIALFFIGGALAFTGGWGIVKKLSKGGAATLNELGNDPNTVSGDGGEIAIVEVVDVPDFAGYFG